MGIRSCEIDPSPSAEAPRDENLDEIEGRRHRHLDHYGTASSRMAARTLPWWLFRQRLSNHGLLAPEIEDAGETFVRLTVYFDPAADDEVRSDVGAWLQVEVA